MFLKNGNVEMEMVTWTKTLKNTAHVRRSAYERSEAIKYINALREIGGDALFCTCSFKYAKAFSIGLRSGLKGD